MSADVSVLTCMATAPKSIPEPLHFAHGLLTVWVHWARKLPATRGVTMYDQSAWDAIIVVLDQSFSSTGHCGEIVASRHTPASRGTT